MASERDTDKDLPEGAPDLAGVYLTGIDAEALEPDVTLDNGDLRYDEDADDVLGEDDDNPDQESDEALPEDEEERAIGRDLGNDDDAGNEQERLDRP